MKNSWKAVLISGLIFPGLGHLTLKKYPKGILLILLSTIAMILIIADVVKKAFKLIKEIETGGTQPSMENITEAVNQSLSFSGNFVLTAGVILLISCWVFGIFDSYLIGNKMDEMTDI